MNEEAQLEAYNLFKGGGYNGDINSFMSLLESNPEAFEVSFSQFKEGGYNGAEEDYKTLIGLKKKEETEVSPSPSTLVQEDTEPVQPGVQPQKEESGSSDSPINPALIPNIPDLSIPDFLLSDEQAAARYKSLIDRDLGPQAPGEKLDIKANYTGSSIPGELGQVIRGEYTTPNGKKVQPIPGFLGKITDILYSYGYGDKRKSEDIDADQPFLINAFKIGLAQSAAVDPGLDMWFAGEEASDALLNRYIKSKEALEAAPSLYPAADHARFDSIMEENGDGVYGFLMALVKEPGVALETMISSGVAMFNPASLKASGTVVGGSFAIGAASNPIPDFRAKGLSGMQSARASLKYAYGAGSMVLETGLSFTEFMKEELEAKGLDPNADFNSYGLRQVLSDPEAVERIRFKSALRGGIIGTVDMIFAGLFSEFGTKLYKVTGRAYSAPLVIVGGEMMGGGVGEATALAATGQELDVKEIGLESVGASKGAVTTTISAFNSPPRVTVRGIEVSQKTLFNKIKNINTVQDLEALGEVNIENSPYLANFLEETTTRLQIENDLPVNVSIEDAKTLIALETQRKKIAGSPLKTNQERLKIIDSQIREITERYMSEGEIQSEQAGGVPIVPKETTTETSETLEGGTEIVTEEIQTESVPLSEVDSKDPSTAPQEELPRGLKVKQQEIEEDLKKENVYLGTTQFAKRNVKEFLQRIYKSQLSWKSFLPKSVSDANKQRTGKIQAEIKEAQQNNKKFEKLLKKEVRGGADGDMINDAFSALLNGKVAPPNVLSPEMKGLAKEMRFHIDRLSQELMDSGVYLEVQGKIGSVESSEKSGFVQIEILNEKGEVIAREQRKGNVDDFTVGNTIKYGSKENIRRNLGEYINRAYKIYESKDWNKQVGDDVKNRAKAYLMKQLRGTAAHKLAIKKAEDKNLKLTDEEVLERLAFQDVDEILASGEMPTNWFNTGKMGSTNKGVLRQRQDLAPEIRALMGEYTQPMQTYALSILKQSQIVSGANFQVEVRKAGLGKFFFEENDPATPEGFNQTIASEGSETMQFLAGLRTTKEIKEAFESQFNPTTMSKALKTYYKGLGLVKWAKTVGDYEVHARNFVGNLGFVMANGHGDVSQLAGSFKVLANDLTTMSDEELNVKMRKYVSLNLISSDSSLGEIKSLFQTSDWETYIEGVMQNQEKKGFWNSVKDYSTKPFKTVAGFMNDVYGGTDNFFKIYAYENEVARYSDAMYGVQYDQLTPGQQAELDGMVSEIVLNTYPTYSRIPKLVRGISKNLMIGTFVAFQAESYRNSWNIVSQAKKELASDNPKIKAIGAKRMAGITAYIGAKGAIQSSAVGGGVTGMAGIPGSIASLAGVGTDKSEENKELRLAMDDFLPPWTKNHQLKIVQAGDGIIKVIDMSSADGLAGVDILYQSVMNSDSPKDGFINGLLEVVGNFGQQDILFKRLEEIKQGRTWEEADDATANALVTAAYLGTILEPGSLARLRDSWFEESNNYMKAGAKAGDFWDVVTGMKPYEIDVKQSLKYKMYSQQSFFESAFRVRNRDIYAGETREEQINRSVEAMKPGIERLAQYYNNAQRFGVSKVDAYNMVYNNGLPRFMTNDRKNDIMNVMLGKKSYDDLKMTYKEYLESESKDKK